MVEPGTILNQQPQRYAILPTTARLKSVDSPPCYLRGKSRHGEMIMSMTTKVLKCHWSQFSLADHFSILNYHPLHRWHSSIPLGSLLAQTSICEIDREACYSFLSRHLHVVFLLEPISDSCNFHANQLHQSLLVSLQMSYSNGEPHPKDHIVDAIGLDCVDVCLPFFLMFIW